MQVVLGFAEVSILEMMCWKLTRQMKWQLGPYLMTTVPCSLMSCQSKIPKSFRNLKLNELHIAVTSLIYSQCDRFGLFTAAKFDAAKHLDTHPALLHRTYNRPTTAMLESQQFPGISAAEEMDSEEVKVSHMTIACTSHGHRRMSHVTNMLITC